MGVELGYVRDEMITASSSRDGNINPKNARLNSFGAWVANTNDKNQYLQVNNISFEYQAPKPKLMTNNISH